MTTSRIPYTNTMVNESKSRQSIADQIQNWELLYIQDGKRYGNELSGCAQRLRSLLCNCRDVAELGCGYGRDLLYLASLSPKVNFMGLDSSPTAVKMACKDAKQRGLSNVSVVADDWLAYTPSKGSVVEFDLIYTHYFLHIFLRECRRTVLERVVRFLADGGLFAATLISVEDGKCKHGRKLETNTYCCYRSRPWAFIHFFEGGEITMSFKEAGLNVLSVQEYVETEHIGDTTEETITWFVIARKIPAVG